jgi:ATP-independent RNA helicase DbpA
MPVPLDFDSLDLKPALLGNLVEIGYTEMTLVQARALPQVLQGRDVIARARTGSGKTAAFGLGLLNVLDPTAFQLQALVLCPTRELAEQVAKEIRRLAQAILEFEDGLGS